MKTILEQIRQELANGADETAQSKSQHFFKEGEQAKVYGVKAAAVAKFAKDTLGKVKCLPKAEIFALCKALKKLCIPCG